MQISTKSNKLSASVVLSAIFLFTSPAFTQTKGPSLNDIYFSDSEHGWILSYTGKKSFILRTVDSGKTWHSHPVSDLLIRIKFADSNTGWGVGANGTVLLTSDGGKTWRPSHSGTTNTLYDLFVIDRNHVWVSGNHGTLLKTDNGGQSWAAKNVSLDMALTGVSFVGAERGWAIGYGTIFSTTDGGLTWKAQSSGDWKQLSRVFFADEKVGWINPIGSTLLKTVDGGASWQEIIIPGHGRAGMSFVDSSHGWVALSTGEMGDVAHIPGLEKLSSQSTVLVTKDGGKSWKEVLQLKSVRDHSAWIFDIFFLNKSNGWAVGSDGLYLRTTDGGEHWQKSYLPGTPSNNSLNRTHN